MWGRIKEAYLVQLEAELALRDDDDGEADGSMLLSSSVLPLFFLLFPSSSLYFSPGVPCFWCSTWLLKMELWSYCLILETTKMVATLVVTLVYCFPLFPFVFPLLRTTMMVMKMLGDAG